MAAATPEDVPVKITSPGSRVNDLVRCSMCSKQLKIKCLVLEFWRMSPFTSVRMPRLCGSPTSSAVTIHGPNGAWVSKDLPICMVRDADCQSRTLTSLPQQ